MKLGVLVVLGLAILAEVVATTSLKASDGFTKFLPVALVIVGYAASFYLLALTLRSLPLGFVYAIWSGFGTAGVVLAGCLIWQESLGLTELIGIGLIVGGVVVLNFHSGVH